MADAPMPRRTAKVRQTRPHAKSLSEYVVEGALYLLAFCFLAATSVLLLPFSAGVLLAWVLPKKRLAAWIMPLLSGAIALLLSTKYELDTWDAQKGAFLALVASQKGAFLENWPKYVTGGPLAVDFGGIPPVWAYFFAVGVPTGFLARKVGLLGFFFPFLTTPSPASSSGSPTATATPPTKGGDGSAKETTDGSTEDSPPYTVLRTLFTRKEAQRYTVEDAAWRACTSRRDRIRYWLTGMGIFGRVHPHLLPCTRLYRGIDRVFGDFYTRLRSCYRVNAHDTVHPTVYQEPIPATDTGQRASYRVNVHGNAPLHGTAWHIGERASYRVSDGVPGSVCTWGSVGQVGSVELWVSPPKVGKTKLATGLQAAQRTGSPFLGWPTVRTGAVWLVEEARSLFDPKRREIMGLPAAPEMVSDRTFRHRVCSAYMGSDQTRVFRRDIGMDQPIPTASREVKQTPFVKCLLTGLRNRYLLGFSFVRRSVALASLTSVQPGLRPDGAPWFPGAVGRAHLYRIARKWARPSAASPGEHHQESAKRQSVGILGEKRKPPKGNVSSPALLAILYGPEVPRGLDALAVHLAVACTVARIRSALTGIPWYVIQVDSLFYWCPEAEQDAAAALKALSLFKLVASFGFLVRVVVHADELTGKVKGPQNITRQCDFLLHLSPLPKTAKARDTTRRRLSVEGRFEDRPRPDDLAYELADNALKALQSAQSLVQPAPSPPKTHFSPAEPGQPAPMALQDAQPDSSGGKSQNGRPGGSQAIGKTAQRLRDLLAVCPSYDQQPQPARPLVKAFSEQQGIQPDRVYVLARKLETAGKLDITFIPGKKTCQWRQSRPK